MHSLDVLIAAISADPADDTAWLALADCLEEQNQPDRAELVRLREWLRHAPHDHPDRQQRETRLQSLLASGVLPEGPRLRVALTKRKSLELALIPPGSFLMGGPESQNDRVSDELPPRRVTLEKAFWVGVYPVTQSQWLAIMDNNPSEFKQADRPVEQLSWHDCLEFCRRLSTHTGRPFRLPTEAEWEYACRAGTTSLYHSGDTLDALKQVGWCSFDHRPGSQKHTLPVGQLVPNAWGLYDMHGNILESCQACEPGQDATDPAAGDDRIVRGGSWGNRPRQCRSGWRYRSRLTARSAWLGCRVLMCRE